MSYHITTALKSYEAKEVAPDSSGNRRYVVHFLALGLSDYPDTIPTELKKLWLKKYRGKDFTGWYVFFAWNVWKKLDQIYVSINLTKFLRAKLITSTNSRLLGNIYTGQEYSDITWCNLQDRLTEYPEIARHEANSDCYFEDATYWFIDVETGTFYPVYI